MIYVSSDWAQHEAEAFIRRLRASYPRAKMVRPYTCATIEGGDLLTLQITVDLGDEKAPDAMDWPMIVFGVAVVALSLAAVIVGLWIAA